MPQNRNLANCQSRSSLFNLKIFTNLDDIEQVLDWRKYNCTCLKPYMYLPKSSKWLTFIELLLQ